LSPEAAKRYEAGVQSAGIASDADDVRIVRGLRSGDEQVFVGLVREHGSSMLYVA